MFKFLYKLIYGTKNSPLIVTLLLVTIFLFVSSVYAWILFNDSVQNGPMNGGVEYDPIKATYEIYYKDQMGETNVRYGFPKEDEDPIEMHTYDSVFVQKNEYNPLVVRVIIESEDLMTEAESGGEKTITIQLTKKTIADSVVDNETVHGNAWKDSYYFTSVMEFGIMKEPSNIDLSGDDNSDMHNIYNAGYSAGFEPTNGTVDPTPVFKSGITTTSFVKASARPENVAATNADKNEVISLSTTYTYSDFRTIDDSGVKKLVIYVLINYDRELMLNGHFAAVSLTHGLDLIAAEFYSDLEIITIK